MWRLEDGCFSDGDGFDPHLVRSRPVDDEEADLIEAICQAATPGPLVTDEVANGGGVLVATLPDGRNIVSLSTMAGGPARSRTFAAANAQLICEARSLLLRLLRDRQRWRRREKCLLEEIRLLEDQLERSEAVDAPEWLGEDPAPSRPR